MKLKRNIAGSIVRRFGARRATFIATVALLFVVAVTDGTELIAREALAA